MTKAEQVRLTAWRLRVLRHAADQRNVAVCGFSETGAGAAVLSVSLQQVQSTGS